MEQRKLIICTAKRNGDIHSWNSQKWRQHITTWDMLVERFSRCERTPETFEQYCSSDNKSGIKDVGGFFGGDLEESFGIRRKRKEDVLSRDLITLDIDEGKQDSFDAVKDCLSGYAWCVYTTHSHCPEKPRFRLVLPLSRSITPEEYEPIARHVAWLVDMEIFEKDHSTYEYNRMMLFPSASSDGEFVHLYSDGVYLDADEILNSYPDWKNPECWHYASNETPKKSRSNNDDTVDPKTKSGIVGAFCRAYSISQAVDAFLPDVYRPIRDKLKYIPSSSAAGVYVKDDTWIYSHHASDPCSGKLLNAFDMVRIHLYQDLDIGCSPKAAMTDTPSYIEMKKMLEDDAKVQDELKKDQNAKKRGRPAKPYIPTEWDTLRPKNVCTIEDKWVRAATEHECKILTTIADASSKEDAERVSQQYRLGALIMGGDLLWHIDINGHARDAFIYRADDKRTWVSGVMKERKLLDNKWQHRLCLFGEHLIYENPDKPIFIVRTEMAALICAALYPDAVWLAVGSNDYLTAAMFENLIGYSVTLFPDCGDYQLWCDASSKIASVLGISVDVFNTDSISVEEDIKQKREYFSLLLESMSQG